MYIPDGDDARGTDRTYLEYIERQKSYPRIQYITCMITQSKVVPVSRFLNKLNWIVFLS